MMHPAFMFAHINNYQRTVWDWCRAQHVEEDTVQNRSLWFRMYCMGGEL